MHSIEIIVEAIIAKTNLMILNAKDWERPHIIAQRLQALAGIVELAYWRKEKPLEDYIEGHMAQLRDRLEYAMHGMSELTIALPAEFTRLCKRDGVAPEVVLCGFIADLCGIMNWVKHPRPDGYSSNGSDERDLAEQYYERVGYPYFHRKP